MRDMSQAGQTQAAVLVPRLSPQRVSACSAGISLTRPAEKYRLYHFFHSTFLQQFFQKDASSFHTLEKQSFCLPSDQSRPVNHYSVLFLIRASEARVLQNFRRGRGPTVLAA